ncbi:MAG: class I mannose-6-phosphate isomerase [Verrucomicrobia bacterium]|nr:class I mannose-6-phosphate isomerase [Verrucomicrobiota bacterium]
MSLPQVSGLLRFEPLLFERVWGGRKLESYYEKALPAGKRIGESWEVVDRAEAQSIVCDGSWRGRSLHDLWVNEREPVFGSVPDAPRFPLLIKLLDCRDRLSLQVHPPAGIAEELGGEPKTECWYVAQAESHADLYLGWREKTSPLRFQTALKEGHAEELIHRVQVKAGDVFFIPSGRIHAIGGGNLIVEVQQNSDTTYRVFDWNRADENGMTRQLHIEQALASIDFADVRPRALSSQCETLVTNELFQLDRWHLSSSPRELETSGRFAIVLCLDGLLLCARTELRPGQLALLPAQATQRDVCAAEASATLLRITIPS